MKLFFDMVLGEYKKIWKRKSAKVAFIGILLINFFSCMGTMMDATVDGKKYDGRKLFQEEKAAAEAIEGSEINGDLFFKVKEKKRLAGDDFASPKAREAMFMESHLRPLTQAVYGKYIDELEVGEADDFDAARTSAVAQEIQKSKLSDAVKEKLLSMNEKVKTPLIYGYKDGYERFLALGISICIFSCFVAAIGIAPMFSGEYGSGADQLLLSSKYGKSRLTYAKIFTGISFGFLNGVIQSLAVLASCLLVYGSGGKDSAFQLAHPLSPYPITMLGAVVICISGIIAGNMLFSATVLFFSAKLKTVFSTIILSLVIPLLTMFLMVSPEHIQLYRLVGLLPGNMGDAQYIFSDILYEIGSFVLQPCQMYWLTALVGMIILFPLPLEVSKSIRCSGNSSLG